MKTTFNQLYSIFNVIVKKTVARKQVARKSAYRLVCTAYWATATHVSFDYDNHLNSYPYSNSRLPFPKFYVCLYYKKA